MARRRANGYGGITKLSGKRSKPYIAYKSVFVPVGIDVPEAMLKTLHEAKNALLEASEAEEIYMIHAKTMFQIEKAAGNIPEDIEEYRKQTLKKLEEKEEEFSVKRVQKKRRIGSYATYAEAEMALALYNSGSEPSKPKQTMPTFADLFKPMYAKNRIAEKSVSLQNRYNQGFDKCSKIHNVPINELRTSDLEAVLKEYEGMSASTQKAPLAVIREIFKYADQHDMIDKDYSVYLKTGKAAEKEDKNPYTRQEVQKVWDNIDWIYKPKKKNSQWYGMQIPKMILILIYTGMRIDELLSLKKKHVNLKEGYINIVDSKTDAGVRIIPIHPAIVDIVKEFCRKNKTYLIETREGQADYPTLKKSPMEAFYTAMGLSHTFHETRHTFASFTHTSKLDSTLRAYIMGHRTNNLTNDVYTHPEVMLPELLEEIKKLEITKKDGR